MPDLPSGAAADSPSGDAESDSPSRTGSTTPYLTDQLASISAAGLPAAGGVQP